MFKFNKFCLDGKEKMEKNLNKKSYKIEFFGFEINTFYSITTQS